MTENLHCAYIMAGGASTRFGQNKALVKLGEQTLLEHIHGLLNEITDRVKVVARAGSSEKWGMSIVADCWPGEGPLGGIITALLESQNCAPRCKWNLIVSCDMPFLTREWLQFLIHRASASAAQIVLPQSAHGPEPLCACWRTDAAATLQTAFESGIRKVTDGIARLRSELLDEKEWKRFDTAGRLFWNMNTPADFATAQRVWEQEKRSAKC